MLFICVETVDAPGEMVPEGGFCLPDCGGHVLPGLSLTRSETFWKLYYSDPGYKCDGRPSILSWSWRIGNADI
jgi:hypothetical protein